MGSNAVVISHGQTDYDLELMRNTDIRRSRRPKTSDAALKAMRQGWH
jgi:hypothetical protein